MKKGLTEMVFILDRSGSMSHLTDDTIGGFNSLIEKQKEEDGEAFVTTVLFSDDYELLHDHIDIKEIKPMTRKDYYAMGCTALLDAIGTTINTVGVRLSETPEEERPEKVIFVITTDGLENSSREFTRSKVKEMIEHQQSKYSWMFMFLGANIDAVSEASSLGIDARHARTYTANAQGTSSVYESVSATIDCLRSVDVEDYSNYVTAKGYCDSVNDSAAVKTLSNMIDISLSSIE